MPSRGFEPRIQRTALNHHGLARSPLPAPCSLFNLLTARELGPKFGPRSVPYALGGKQDMNTEHKVRSRSLRGMDARPGPAGTAPRPLLPAALALGLALSARAPNPPLPPPPQAAPAPPQAVPQNPGPPALVRPPAGQAGATPDHA